jgi:hypothetical protein
VTALIHDTESISAPRDERRRSRLNGRLRTGLALLALIVAQTLIGPLL